MANTTVKGKFNVVDESGNVQTIYPKTTGDQVLVDRSSNASVIPNDVANLQHIVNKMGALAFKSKVETSDFTTGTMIGVNGTGNDPCANLKANTDAGKIADALIVKNIEYRVDTLENSNLVTVDELDAGLATKPDTEINDAVTSTSLTWSSKKLSDQLTTLNSNTSLLTNRVNTLIELPDGATTNDARLEDIRNGYDGIKYDSPGDAVRGQIHSLSDALAYIEPINKFNPNTIIENAFINEYGSTTTYQGIFTSDFIPCTGGQIFRFARKSGNSFYYSDANVSSFAQYDSNKTFISGTKQTYANNVTLESNTKYVRFSNPMSMMQSEGALLCVMFDTVPTADNISAYFEPHYSVITPEIAQIIDDVNDNTDDISALSNEVDSQANDIEDLKKMVILVEPENKLNMSAIAENTIIAAGTETYNDTCFTTDFIKASAGDTVTFAVIQNGTFYHTTTKMIRVSMYNSAKEFIESSSMFIQDYVIETENTAYIRVSVPNMALTADIASITLNTAPTSESISEYFTPYFKILVPELESINEQVQENVNQITAIQQKDAQQDQEIEHIKKMGVLIEPENKLNLDTITENTIISAGTETYNDTCFTTDFIKASAGDTVIFAVIQNGTFSHAATKIVRVSMYNSAKEFIESSSMFIQDYVIETENTAYIRVSVPNMALNADIASITLNIIPTAESISEYFTPYYSVHGVSDETKKSRRVLWLGTSIPTYGYPQILGRLCGATIINNSIGSSCIAKGINSNITTANICGIQNKYGLYSLCQTVQEKQTMINNWNTIASELGTSDTLSNSEKSIALSSSYETELDPYLTGDAAVNLIVINHAYNDSAAQENALIADDPFDTHTLEGAYNWIIRRIVQANPNIGIVIFGHYTDLPEHKETALSRVAERWNIPYYQLKNDLGWSNEVITTTKKIDSNGEWTTIESTQMTIKNMWCADNIHPIGTASTKIAYVAQPIFEQWLKMYCT